MMKYRALGLAVASKFALLVIIENNANAQSLTWDGAGTYACRSQGSFGQGMEHFVTSNSIKINSEQELKSFEIAFLTEMRKVKGGTGLGWWCRRTPFTNSLGYREEPIQVRFGVPARAIAKTQNSFAMCVTSNERTYMRDMPVFVSQVFALKSGSQFHFNYVSSQWLGYVRSQPGFQGGTNGGCHYGKTASDARALAERNIATFLRSYSWAYRRDTDWVPE